jgi:ERCC4-type nuclease
LKKPIQIDIQSLDLADAIIKRTFDQKEVVYIERKSIADLLASIKDGRYEEQSYRLANASGMPTHHIIYIIEGFLSSVSVAEKKLVLSVITSLNVFKGFSVLRTANVHETAELLITMTDKIGRDLEKGRMPVYFAGSQNININSHEEKNKTNEIIFTDNANSNIHNDTINSVCNDENDRENCVNSDTNNGNISYSTVVKKVKKENLTPANMAEIVLCQIPGISSKTAIAIMAKNGGGSLMNLLKCLEKDPDYLCDILLENGRKINKNSAIKITEYLS